MRAWYLLLLAPFLALLYPPLYNRIDPTLLGMPFFYWYQLSWVVITAALLSIVYLLTKKRSL